MSFRFLTMQRGRLRNTALTNSRVSFYSWLLVAHEHNSKVVELLYLLHCIVAQLQHALTSEDTYNRSVFSVLIFMHFDRT